MLSIDTRCYFSLIDIYGTDAGQALLLSVQGLYSIVQGVLSFYLAELFPITILMGFVTVVQGVLPVHKLDDLERVLRYTHPSAKLTKRSQSALGAFFSMDIFQPIIRLLPAALTPHAAFCFELKHKMPSRRHEPAQSKPHARSSWTAPAAAGYVPATPSPTAQKLMHKCEQVFIEIRKLVNHPHGCPYADVLAKVQAPPVYHTPELQWIQDAGSWYAIATRILEQVSPPSCTSDTVTTAEDALEAIGLPRTFNLAHHQEIRKAWKRAILRSHPDKGGSTEAQQRINDAKAILEGLGVFAPS